MALSRPASARRDLVACAAVLALGGVLALLGAPTGVRAAVEVPLVLFVPGYLVVVAAFAADPPAPLLRAVLAAALSLALAAVGSVVLDAAGVRLERASFVGLLELVGLVALFVASARRRPAPAPGPRAWRSAWPQVALGAVVVALVGGGIAAARTLPAAHGIAGSSTLWALPAGDGRVTIGVRSLEVAPATFRVVVRADAGVVSEQRIRLAPGASWERTIAVPAGEDPEVELAGDGERTLEHSIDLTAAKD